MHAKVLDVINECYPDYDSFDQNTDSWRCHKPGGAYHSRAEVNEMHVANEVVKSMLGLRT